MSKHDSRSPPTFGDASKIRSREYSGSSKATATRRSALGEIGFVGLGRMGVAMAANLAAEGRQVIAYVRHPDQIGKLEALGLRPTTDIGDLLHCEVVISMLPDDDAVSEIVLGRADVNLAGLAAGLGPGAIHLSMSTISTTTASLLANAHARNGQGYVSAPVFGNPEAAKARQLFIVAAGAPADIERCRPVLDGLGQRTFVIGADPGDANLVKLLGNMMSATALEMLGEVVAVIRKRGLDPQPFIDIMTSTMFGGRAHKIYGDKIAKQTYAPGFVLPLVLKDVRLALAEAEKAGVPMPSVGVVRDRLITGIARGHGELDWTALGLIAAEEAGLVPVPAVIGE
ncbi:NAD(P)-dependent oxidoreductase [Bradyrhizobium canariense]|uniref:3-hydroxyisobutyrate dehydrogenase n=1 Tax=Bradyrhizobium canariense TaxID=255045 RepID=A0A1H2AW41_9BRAD|nr:NAD(P)-dependent oxidoreductase [Bradyrhizobium canariense]SDT50141.1 3-hydroxyisobutyrate dehydrogenase [Bradyrhizobium canariense]